jgi:hypothetical protein
MLMMCRTLDVLGAKGENRAKLMFLLIPSRSSQSWSSTAATSAWLGDATCMVTIVMEGGDASLSKQPITKTLYMGRGGRGRRNRSVESGHSGRWAWSQ